MDDDIQAFLDQIKEVNYQLKSLTKTVIDGESAMAKALGIQKQAVTASTVATTKQTAATTKQTSATAQQTVVIEKATKGLAELTRTQREEYEETKRKIQQNIRDRDVVTDLMNEFGRGTSATQVLRQQFEKGSDGAKILTAGFEGLAKSITSYASAIYRGERGQLAAAKAATEFTKPLIQLGEIVGTAITVLSFFVPAARAARLLGLALAGTAKAVGLVNDLNEKAAEQTDKLFKSFTQLSAAGVGMQGGFDGMFKTLQQMGYSVAEIEEFNRVIGSSVDKLSMVGPTAAGGLRQFAEVSGRVVKEYGRELEMMGVNRDEQRQAALAYMSLQARIGQLQFKNTQQLAAESAKFAKELDLSAQIMGTSREAQQKAIDANMADARFRAAQRDAELRGDKEEMERLQKANVLAAQLRAAGMTEEATGVLQFAAGGMTTPAAIKANMQFGLEAALSDRSLTTNQLLERTLGNAQEMNDRLTGVNRMVGGIDVLQGDIAKIADANVRLKQIQEEAAKKGVSVDEFLKSEQGLRMLGDKQLGQYVDATRAQQNIAMSLDGTVRAFAQTGNTFKSATGMFAEAVRAMPGAKPFGGGYAGGAAGPAGPAAGAATVPGRAASKMPAGPAAPPSLSGLRIKSAESTAGGETSPRLLALAQQIQNTLGGDLTHFSAFNDSYHKGTGSKHAQGMALDFTVRSPKDSQGYVNLVQDVMAKSGLTGKVLNEYVNPSRSATGGHIHVEIDQFKDGGIATGPKTGYPATLHGTEAVIPMGDGRSIPINMPGVVEELRELVSLSRRQVSASEKLLQYSQS